MSEGGPVFDPARYERLSTGTVPGYAALQELVALAVAAESPPSAKVLDLGCGTGAGVVALARALPEAELVACDPLASMVTAARARCDEARVGARWVVGGLEEVEAAGPFDAVVCTLVLHFVPPRERAAFLTKVRERLVPGGVLVITTLERADAPEIDGAWRRIRRHHAISMGVAPDELAAREAETRGKVHPLTSAELRDELLAAGFAAVMPTFQLLAVHGYVALG